MAETAAVGHFLSQAGNRLCVFTHARVCTHTHTYTHAMEYYSAVKNE